MRCRLTHTDYRAVIVGELSAVANACVLDGIDDPRGQPRIDADRGEQREQQHERKPPEDLRDLALPRGLLVGLPLRRRLLGKVLGDNGSFCLVDDTILVLVE